MEEELFLNTMSVPGAACQLLVPLQVLASLSVGPEALLSGHIVGFAKDSKFSNSSKMVYVNGLGIMARNGRQRAWRWAGEC